MIYLLTVYITKHSTPFIRYSSRKVHRGGLVWLGGEYNPNQVITKTVGVVADCQTAARMRGRISDDFIAAYIKPETPDSVIENKYGTIRMYHCNPPGFAAVYWLKDEERLRFSESRATVGRELEQAFTEAFLRKQNSMPKIKYTDYRPNKASQQLIDISNTILEDYRRQGYQLTLRQLYYQLVSRDIIPNTVPSYNRLGGIISQAREGGLIDWNHIVDRSRRVRSNPHWLDGKDFLKSVAPQFGLDWWTNQDQRPIVFVEKEALEEIVGMACEKYDVPYFANKGYLSASSVWHVAHNLMRMADDACSDYVIFHLGDHDPSGIDMSRDIEKRLNLFSGGCVNIEVVRLALNMDQIVQYNPPPNPAKETDSRFADYQKQYGDDSWELDALEPSVIDAIISQAITDVISDPAAFKARQDLQAATIQKLLRLRIK